jgi:membrane-associated phospholipid phosphatase
MRVFFHKIFENIKRIFWGRNLLWHFGAIVLTYILVMSGFDWFFFQLTRSSVLKAVLWPAVPVGALVPLFGILIFFVVSALKKDRKLTATALALGQAALLGLATSDFYKFFTGRPGPPDIFGNASITDTSHIFHFGILQGGIFFGWPSSHTTVAFAMATTLLILYRNNKFIRYASIIYALYIGISVSVTIHWFSDFAAGVIIGSVIGAVVGKSFLILFSLDKGKNEKIVNDYS